MLMCLYSALVALSNYLALRIAHYWPRRIVPETAAVPLEQDALGRSGVVLAEMKESP
jgi:hypothetical protein